MKFGPVDLDEAEGAILAHGVRAGPASLAKGIVLGANDIAALRTAGVNTVVAATMEPGDIGEDEAAQKIAASISGNGFSARAPSTGRVNLHADTAGLFVVDAARVDRLNTIDPAITLATLRNFSAVRAREMVATVKIIPFGVAEDLVAAAEAVCAPSAMLTVHPLRPLKVGLIQTRLERTKESVLDKTARVMSERLARSGSAIVEEYRTGHDVAALVTAVGKLSGSCDLTVVFGASATSDREDVIPAAIEAAGGHVERVGMPVDPGNLITVGMLEGKPVLGAPGCARSPKENGFDWVLDRIAAGLPVDNGEIAGMGVGGLLSEIHVRPRPRDPLKRRRKLKVHALLLAAGQSSRMGRANKLLAEFDGMPLVRRIAARIAGSGISGLTVVTGHQAEDVRLALDGLTYVAAHNPDYATGLSSSLKTGIQALPGDADGCLVALADMPKLSGGDIQLLVDAFVAAGGTSIVRATHSGKRGNPVILPAAVFGSVEQLSGDVGARQMIESGLAPVIDVEIGAAASLDVDTPEMMKAAGGVLAETEKP